MQTETYISLLNDFYSSTVLASDQQPSKLGFVAETERLCDCQQKQLSLASSNKVGISSYVEVMKSDC